MTLRNYLTNLIFIGSTPFLAPWSKVSLKRTTYFFTVESFSALKMWMFAKKKTTAQDFTVVGRGTPTQLEGTVYLDKSCLQSRTDDIPWKFWPTLNNRKPIPIFGTWYRWKVEPYIGGTLPRHKLENLKINLNWISQHNVSLLTIFLLLAWPLSSWFQC